MANNSAIFGNTITNIQILKGKIMNKRTAIRIISFCFAALFVASGFLWQSVQKNKRYELQIENGLSRSLEDFTAGINNIALTLKKAQYVTTPKQISTFAAKLLTEAELSKNALSQLPQSEELTAINKFLSQVGNYAMSVSKSLISTGEISADHRENIVSLSAAAEKVSNALNSTHITYNNADYWATELESKVTEAVESGNLSTALSDLEGELTDYPTLVYDGPYSDHILEKEPQMLKDAEGISEAEALKKAAQLAVCEENYLKADGMVYGNIPAYRFSGQGVTVTVSRKGGYGVYMRKERTIENSLLSYEQAVTKATRYLSKIGMESLTATYYFTTEGVCVINFAYLDGSTICYTDLIKVGIALDNGEIMLYEASGYISNHTDRAFETPAYTAEEAVAVLSDSLVLEKTALANIPTSGGEARCFEFTCKTADNEEILVYVNTKDLSEEDVLILLKSDGGTLVK